MVLLVPLLPCFHQCCVWWFLWIGTFIGQLALLSACIRASNLRCGKAGRNNTAAAHQVAPWLAISTMADGPLCAACSQTA